ncbi:MAG: serine O-acetyltransferase EpsC [Bradymonadia bacterium]
MNEKLVEQVTEELLASYARTHQPTTKLPEQDRVIELLSRMSRLLFPGYYHRGSDAKMTQRYYLSAELCEVEAQLSSVILRSLAYPDQPNQNQIETAHQASEDFIKNLPVFREQLIEDANAALEGDPAASSIDEIILTYPGFRAITIYRLAHWLYAKQIPILPRIMTEYGHGLTGIDIHPGAQIGRRFFIDHGTGVVVGESTVIGNDVKLYQGVTLGAHSVDRKQAGNKRHPTLEDRVVIYAGATVLGGETTIGSGSVVGGNVWLTRSVEPNTMVLATPASLEFRQMDGTKEASS